MHGALKLLEIIGPAQLNHIIFIRIFITGPLFLVILIDCDEVNLRHTLLVDEVFSEEQSLIHLIALHSYGFERFTSQA